MAVQDVEKLKRPGTDQTWEETFKGIDQTSEKFDELVTEFVKFVGEWKDFSETRRDRLTDYIVDLEKIQNSWKEINNWIEENSDSLEVYTGSLSGIRDLFQEIASEAGGVRRQTNDRVNIVRNLARLTNDNLVLLKQEEGLTNKGLSGLRKRIETRKEEFEAQLKIITGQKDLTGLSEKDWRLLSEKEYTALKFTQNQIAELSSQRRLTEGEKAHLRILREQEKEHQINLEYLNEYNRAAVEGLVDRVKKQQEYLREQRMGGRDAGENATGYHKVAPVVRVMKGLGLSEQANNLDRTYGRWVTRRVEAKMGVYEAGEKVKQQKGLIKSAEANIQDKQQNLKDAKIDVKHFEEEVRKATIALNSLAVEVDEKGQKHYKDEKASGKAFARALSAEKKLATARKNVDKAKEAVDNAKKSKKAYEEGLSELEKDEQKAQDFKNTVFQERFELGKKIVGSVKEGIVQGTLALALATAMFRQLLKFDEEAVKTKRVIGQWADYSATANTKFVTGTEVLKTMVQLGQQFNINPAQVFSPEELARITRAQKFTGMTAEAAGNLAVQSKIAGKNADTYRDAIAKGANAANAQNHAAVNLSAVQNDVLNTSRAIALSYGNGTERLAKAASTAASLGMNLQQVEDISRNLMNFESSIQSEMQAQLLTGMQLNLAKAREYALNNDLEGVAREISNQGMNAAKFSHMNYIQQENMAKALGMSREQMSKMLIMQEINRGLTAEQVAAMTGMRKEDIEALSAQEKWQTMKQKFLESLVPLLEPILQVVTEILRPVASIVGFLTKIIGFVITLGGITEKWPTWLRGVTTLAMTGIVALIGHMTKLMLVSKGVRTVFSGWGTAIEGAATRMKAFARLQRMRRNAEGVGEIAGQQAKRKGLGRLFSRGATTTASQAGNAAKGPSAMGKAVGSLGKSMGNILKGAAAALLIAGAVFILAKAAQEFMKVSWEGIAKATVGMLTLVGMVTLLGLAMNTAGEFIVAGALAMVILAGATALLGLALKQFNDIKWETIGMIPVALLALAAAGALSLIAGPTLLAGSTALLVATPVLTAATGALSLVAKPLANAATRISDSFTALSAIKFKKPDLSELKEFAAELKEVSGELREVRIPTLKLGATTALSGIVGRIASRRRSVEVPAENLQEKQGIQKENIEASVQEITVKQAQIQASAQQFTLEQKAADLSKVEGKLDMVIKAIEASRPDWDWLKFGVAMRQATPFMG